MQISDISKRPANRKGRAIRGDVMRPVSHCPRQKDSAARRQQRRRGIQESHEHVLLNDTLIPWNDGVKDIEMVEVVERVRQYVDERNHPKATTVFELTCDHECPLSTQLRGSSLPLFARCSASALYPFNTPRISAAYSRSRKYTRKRKRPKAPRLPGNLSFLSLNE